MKTKNLLNTFLTLTIAMFLISLNGCKTAKTTGDDSSNGSSSQSDSQNNPTNGDENTLGDSDSGKAMGLKTIYFPLDAYDFDEEGKASLQSNIEILKSKSTLKIQVEGHCDQRGGVQYNIALGEKRANAVKNALKAAGISADRIAIISYGKEKPVDAGLNEAAYAKNRRANFAVTAK